MNIPTLKPWLLAQLVWLVMAVIYNAIGIWNMAQGERALLGDAPEQALLGCLPPALIILAGFLNWDRVYRYLAPLALIALAVIGFGRHFILAQTAEGMARYSSEMAWWSAVLINGYGTLVFAGGLFVAWSLASKDVKDSKVTYK